MTSIENITNDEDEEDMDIVVKRVDEISVYENQGGEVVVRQVACMSEEHCIVFPKQYAKAIASKIMEVAGQ